MLKKLLLLTALLVLAQQAHADEAEQCTGETETAFKQCLSDAADSCRSAYPVCEDESLRLDAAVAAAKVRCVDQTNSAVGCRKCLTALIYDVRHGAGRILFPAFSIKLTSELRDLREVECKSVTDSDSSASEPGSPKFPRQRPGLGKR